MSRLLCLVALLSSCGAAKLPPPAGKPSAETKTLREACTFASGAKPFDTLGNDVPLGPHIGVDHIILVMQENRSFDNYFSGLSHGGVRVAPPNASNLDSTGVAHSRYHETKYCVGDPEHSWNGSHQQWDNGLNDGFVISSGADGAHAMGYYDESDLPYYYALARTFALSDAHFCSLMGPTQPNRLYLWAATSFGNSANALPPQKVNNQPVISLFSRLNAAGVSWKVYATNIATPSVFINILSNNLDNFRPFDEFARDAAAGTLASVSIVEAQYNDSNTNVPDESDEHASANIQKGQVWTSQVIASVMNGPLWPSSALFLTYDEHGGFYDSVPPPPACEPDAMLPAGHPDQRFDRFGFRVPLLVVSPFAKRGYVSHDVSDHTSLDRFIEARFDLPAMTARDANADALLDLFDFEHPDTSVPTLPTPTVDAAREAQCQLDYPP